MTPRELPEQKTREKLIKEFKNALNLGQIDKLQASITPLSKDDVLKILNEDTTDSLLLMWLIKDASTVESLFEALKAKDCLNEIFKIVFDGKTILQEAVVNGRLDVLKCVLTFCPQYILNARLKSDETDLKNSLLQLSIQFQQSGFNMFKFVHSLYEQDAAERILAFTNDDGRINILANSLFHHALFNNVLSYFPKDDHRDIINSFLFQNEHHNTLNKSLIWPLVSTRYIGKGKPDVDNMIAILQLYPEKWRRPTLNDKQGRHTPFDLAKEKLKRADLAKLNHFLSASDAIIELEKACQQYWNYLTKLGCAKIKKPYAGLDTWVNDNRVKLQLLMTLKNQLTYDLMASPHKKFTDFHTQFEAKLDVLLKNATPFELTRIQHIFAVIFTLGGFAVVKAIQAKMDTGSFAYYKSRDVLFVQKIRKQAAGGVAFTRPKV